MGGMATGRSPCLLAVTATQEVLLYGSILLVVIVAFFIALTLWKRRFFAGERHDLGINSIADMRQAGLISDEEFATLRKKALGLEKTGLQAPRDKTGAQDPAGRKKSSSLSKPAQDVDLSSGAESDKPPQDEEKQ
jgi:hypothetical protein